MTKRVMHPRAVDTAFAKAFNLLGKMGPRELRDKMEEMGYKPGTGLFKELIKSRGKSRFKDGGLAEAIEKVKAKEMKEGGNVPKPKMRPKKDPFRADKTVILNEEFSKRVAKTNEEAMKKAKKMQGGGEAKFGGKSSMRSAKINTPTGRRMMAEIRKIMPGASVDEVKKFGLKAGILKMEKGGEVPAKFKGFSKLPESVQQKMNPDLAEKFGMGGDVKAKKSGNICRGRGIARQGTGFTIR
tara:strand:+ start:610 stop:1332 length:723 start_codon:yes stop_codon:yes gene_type:complete